MGRKRPFGEVLRLISFACWEARSCQDYKKEQPHQIRPSLQASVPCSLPEVSCCLQNVQSLKGKEICLQNGLKESSRIVWTQGGPSGKLTLSSPSSYRCLLVGGKSFTNTPGLWNAEGGFPQSLPFRACPAWQQEILPNLSVPPARTVCCSFDPFHLLRSPTS